MTWHQARLTTFRKILAMIVWLRHALGCGCAFGFKSRSEIHYAAHPRSNLALDDERRTIEIFLNELRQMTGEDQQMEYSEFQKKQGNRLFVKRQRCPLHRFHNHRAHSSERVSQLDKAIWPFTCNIHDRYTAEVKEWFTDLRNDMSKLIGGGVATRGFI